MEVSGLFLLLRLGLELQREIPHDTSMLQNMSEKDWVELMGIVEKQGVSAIALDGMNVLVSNCDKSFHCGVKDDWWKMFLLQWMGTLLLVEQKNRHQIEVTNDIAKKWACEGVKVMVMKGQSNGLLYPQPLHRSSGDIDCYLFDDYALGNELARLYDAEVDEKWYKHSVIHYQGETIENHQYFVLTREGHKSKQLQKELEDALEVKEWKRYPGSKVLLPPVQWNAMFLTYHACAHFLKEGLLLKQILDWAMFLQKEQGNVDWEQFYAFCNRYHLRRFVDAITAICVDYLGVQVLNPAITANSPFVDKMLESTLHDDDYVHVTGASLWGSRLHLINSLFKHRWKYKEIYQQSVWKQLWWYFTGFLFHTER